MQIQAWAVVNFDYPQPFYRINIERNGIKYRPWAIFTTKKEAQQALKINPASKVIRIIINYEQK